MSSRDSAFSQSETTVQFESGGHRYFVRTYSAIKKEPGVPVCSSNFKVGQHEWQIVCFPGGESQDVADYVSLFLGYRGPDAFCEASWTLRCVNQLNHKDSRQRVWAKADRYNTFTRGRRWGWQKFLKKDILMNPAKGFLVNDTLIFETAIDVHKTIETTDSALLEQDANVKTNYPVPPSSLHQDLGLMLDSEDLADVVFFLDNGQKQMRAHSQILAARSPVFSKALSEGNRSLAFEVKEKDTIGKEIHINIPDVESAVFRELLAFIYTDKISWLSTENSERKRNNAFLTPTKPSCSLPTMRSTGLDEPMNKKRKLSTDGVAPEGGGQHNINDVSIKRSLIRMACSLLEASDKYEINRLRLMCEHFLQKKLNTDNIASMLSLADKHDARHLKEACFMFFTSNASDLVKTKDIKSLDSSLMNELLANIVAKRSHCHGALDIRNEPPTFSRAAYNFSELDYHELRRELVARGISTMGDKDELLRRLQNQG